MATYKAIDCGRYSYTQTGYIQCLCGDAAELGNGSHRGCPRLPTSLQALDGFPVCRFCHQPICCNVNKTGSTAVPHKGPGGVLWARVECNPNCSGYAYDGVNPANPNVKAPAPMSSVVAATKHVFSPEELEHRRILLTERVKQVVAIAMMLGHDGEKLPEIDISETTSLVFTCAYCGGTVEMSRKTHPAIAFKGEIVQFRCKATKK